MKPRSSTSASRSRPHTYALVFFGTMFLLFLLFNLGLTRFYLSMRGSTKGGEWHTKTAFLQKHSSHNLDFIFLGDSTVACGIRPSLMKGNGYNLARSGMDPSELNTALNLMTENKVGAKIVFISLFPGFMSQNDWKNGFAVPYGVALGDAMAQFYEDSNSMKPMLLFGNGTLTRFFERKIDSRRRANALEKRRIDPDGAHLIEEATRKPHGTEGMPSLRIRQANFRMLTTLKKQLEAQKIRVIWVHLPYRSDYQKALESAPSAKHFYTYYVAEVNRIFGSEIIDMRGVLQDDDFKDWAHPLEGGASKLSRALDLELGKRMLLVGNQ